MVSYVDRFVETFKYVVTYSIIMYVEKRKVKGKELYYLGHSFREGGKVHKIRKYLGADLNKDRLKEREDKLKVLY